MSTAASESKRCRHGLPEGQCAICLTDPDRRAEDGIRESIRRRERVMGEPEATGEKVKRCTVCGETKPLGEFYENIRMKGGYINQCKDCVNKRRAENAKKARDRTRPGKIDSTADGNGKRTLFLIMDEHPDILDKLEAAAREQVRTPELQALYYIKIGLKQYEAAKNRG